MNDEPRSHKKATAALVAVLLLGYVGGYLGLRLNKSVHGGAGLKPTRPFARVIIGRERPRFSPSPEFLNSFYKPLRFLDYKATGIEIYFVGDSSWQPNLDVEDYKSP